MKLKEKLKEHFGFTSFRSGQEEIIKDIINGKNVLAILPTGGGKSLCFQLPALLSNSISIVISPLISLMKDQVDSINKNNLNAVFINSSLDPSDYRVAMNLVTLKKVKLVYLSPEKLSDTSFIKIIKDLKPSYLFIDEAHCISEWGHNFRPSFRKIIDFVKFLEIDSVSAFTATANQIVREDIVKLLEMKNPSVYVEGFERPNISIKVITSTNKKKDLVRLFNKLELPAIVYTATRRSAEETANELQKFGFNATYYHGALNAEIRKMIQDDFINEKIEIICATNAFGMGIDKSNIRTVVHYEIPSSIENYYQEIGRAGRDGNESKAILLYNPRDIVLQRQIINSSYPDFSQIMMVYDLILNYYQIGIGSSNTTFMNIDENIIKLAILKKISESQLKVAINALVHSGYFRQPNSLHSSYSIKMIVPQHYLREFIDSTPDSILKDITITLLRIEGLKLFNSVVKLNVEHLSGILDITVEQLIDKIKSLSNMGLAQINLPAGKGAIQLIGFRIKANELKIDSIDSFKYRDYQLSKVNQIQSFAESEICRSYFILDYFGERHSNFKCGKCDNCNSFDNELDFDISQRELTSVRIDYEKEEELFLELRKIRAEAARKFNQPEYLICKDELLKAIVLEKPKTPAQLMSIKGFSLSRYNKIGVKIIELLNE
ncbi:MAG: RecQ family ATP-dependent DNA helicase [Ignavibacteriaceae bacterium]|jgi:ATP-dependent DNA helicase RecQ|nr:RecQ family ATP-dependent DNA helicase [Ignavibacteriaceae bacterium]